ncbi:MAG: hypothetical protein AAGE59_30610 [Cyanobacteria bacterium P01_F01_bin.86]
MKPGRIIVQLIVLGLLYQLILGGAINVAKTAEVSINYFVRVAIAMLFPPGEEVPE